MKTLIIFSTLAALAFADYGCHITHRGMRVHEGSRPTVYDCVDPNCHNTCRGGQCVAYVVCNCRSRSTNNRPATTGCWSPGRQVAPGGGACDGSFPVNTAVATFSGGSYNGHAGVFMGCSGSTTIRLWDQGCCRQLGETPYGQGDRRYSQYHAIELRSGCNERPEVYCRTERAGGRCCEVWEEHCKKELSWIPEDLLFHN